MIALLDWAAFQKLVQAAALRALSQMLLRILIGYMSTGRLPAYSKKAKLVLIHKYWRDRTAPPTYIKICFLSSMGKFSKEFLSQGSRDISLNTVRICLKKLPTISVDCAINVIKRKVQKNDVVVALSIDIVNGFNSLACEKMKEVLEHHMFL